MTDDLKKLAAAIQQEIAALAQKNVPNIRTIRKKYSQLLAPSPAREVVDLARELFKTPAHRWVAFELIFHHKSACRTIGKAEIEEFGQDLTSWGAVDAFAGLIAGPAWLHGQIKDDLVVRWTQSEDPWWRRVALVCTVVLNKPAFGGCGDTVRTLKICRLLVDDRHDMVIKGLSWALRELTRFDSQSVRKFVQKNHLRLATRVKREVNNKLTTGKKNPKK
jgi:3-methyladenine DNA glycosylase AlkD